MKFFVGCFFFLVVLLFIYVGPRTGTLGLLLWGLGFMIFELIQAWSRYGHYLPKAYQHWMSAVLACVAAGFGGYGRSLLSASPLPPPLRLPLEL